MKLRDIRPEERPLCQTCGKPLIWSMTSLTGTPRREFFGWFHDCDCVDESRLAPDEINDVFSEEFC